MKRTVVLAGVVAAAAISAGGYGLYTLGMKRGVEQAPHQAATARAPISAHRHRRG
jgi:hypothetical protein